MLRFRPVAAADLVSQDDTADDADSALGDDACVVSDYILFLVRATPAYIACRADSTASLTTSILAYRNIRGRTYHSDRYSTDYFLPNDGQQLDSMDITYDFETESTCIRN